MKVSLKKIQEMSQGPPNPQIRSAKVQLKGFSIKTLSGFEKIFLFWVRMNPSNVWKGKLEVASLLPSKSMYRQCVSVVTISVQ